MALWQRTGRDRTEPWDKYRYGNTSVAIEVVSILDEKDSGENWDDVIRVGDMAWYIKNR